MKRIFISRALSFDSPIRFACGEMEIIDHSLIEISPLEFEAPNADWIFFYSKNGVKHFFNEGSYQLYPYKWACIGQGTARLLAEYIQDISFVGNGDPEVTAAEFKTVRLDNEVVCYIRANNSQDTIRNILNSKNDFSIPVYDNQPKKNIPEGPFDIVVFTSPMNANVFLLKNKINNSIVIAIGHTTARSLQEAGIQNILIAKDPSEEGIAEVIKGL